MADSGRDQEHPGVDTNVLVQCGGWEYHLANWVISRLTRSSRCAEPNSKNDRIPTAATIITINAMSSRGITAVRRYG